MHGFRAFAPSLATRGPGFRESFFAELFALEAQNFWFRARNELILWAMSRYFSGLRNFLEIGCGTGYVLSGVRAAFPSAALVGSEIFVSGLAFAAGRVPSAEFYQIDATAIPFREHFDVIGAFDVLEHIEDDESVLQQVTQALVPGGGFLLTVPQHPSLWSPQDDHAHHVRRYTAVEIRRKLMRSGLEVIRVTSFMSLLLPMMAASRLRMRASRADGAFDAMAELRQPRAINAILEHVMGAERLLIRHGVSFPAGGSLLVVARRPRSMESIP